MDKKLSYNTPWILQRADPYVYRHTDGTYYFTASVPEYDRIVLRSGRSLVELSDAPEYEIWHKHESGPQSIHIWAPELHYLFGKWYIYYAGGDKDDIWAIRPYVLECEGDDPVRDPWIEKGKMARADGDEFSFEAFSLDATVFEVNGRWYYVWAEKVGVGKQISNLYIARMKNGYTLDTVQVLLTTPDYDWERYGFWVNEGPAVLQRDGKVFLTYSASDTGIHYCMGILMPMRLCWIRCRGRRNVIRCLAPAKRQASTGRGIILLRPMRRGMILWYIMPERRRKLWGIRCIIRTAMRCL